MERRSQEQGEGEEKKEMLQNAWKNILLCL